MSAIWAVAPADRNKGRASLPEFLLEVGFEEMPAPWLPGLVEQVRQRFDELAGAEHLSPADTVTLATPRRLVLRATVGERQADREEKMWGPSVKVARDAAGAWTGAALGFAKKSGVRPDDLQHASKDGGDAYLFHLKKTAGRAAAEVLPGVIGGLLRALAFPKRMSWDAWIDDGKGAFPFGRPIRWMVALLGGKVVPFVIHSLEDGARGKPAVEAGPVTYGHRFLPRGKAGKALSVRSFADLDKALAKAFVILDPAARDARIHAQLAAIGVEARAGHQGLVGEWRHLAEYPTIVSGTIPAEFHALPVEVLETVLVHHQKYVPIVGGGQVTRFAALTDTDGSSAARIVQGMERVVVARLRDAAFFYREDLKRPLADRVEDLAGVTFHRDLGSYRDKAARLARVVDGPMAGSLDEKERRSAHDATQVAKADLTTLMVREFPELQGVMGALYLKAAGAPREVAMAVRWHYHPVSVEEGSAPAHEFADVATSRVFAAVSVADKMDTLAGYFGLGLVPTGSSDPFGLRRAGQGVIRALLDFWPARGQRPGLRSLIATALDGYGQNLKKPRADVERDLEAFLLDRMRYVLVTRGFAADEVEAVLGAREPDALDDPQECLQRLRALHRVRIEATEDFDHLAVAFKRARNILAGQVPAPVDQALLGEAAERELHEAVGRLASIDGGYEARLRSLAGLRAPVDRFFDEVMVMAEDPKVRANRLGLLSQALSLFYRIADISKLGG
jgi:glycyl-tRNA synthetase beta chain